jgi:hypothetical protein
MADEQIAKNEGIAQSVLGIISALGAGADETYTITYSYKTEGDKPKNNKDENYNIMYNYIINGSPPASDKDKTYNRKYTYQT